MREKNPAYIQIELSFELKELFKKSCKDRQTTMTFELRRFMRAYVNTPFIEDRVYYAPVKTN